ncbi:MAG: CBU_0592 family membrane protein [Chitinophagaceae bacterium]
MNLNDWIGIIGVGLILLAFFGHTFKLISGDSLLFFALNFIGAGLACYASYLIRFWPFVVLEGIWTLVSLIGIIRVLAQKK